MGHVKQKILLVEDNAVQILVLKQLVKESGHTVISVVDRGEEAIKKAAELEPDLIIMDVFLNGDMNGIQAMQEINGASDIPVIYISGNSDPFYMRKAHKQGCVAFLLKPVRQKDLTAAIKKVRAGKKRGKNKKSGDKRWIWPFSLFF